MTTERRIAIIGAGIIGCLIAREILHAQPRARVIVIDRDLAGQGASRRSAGMHFPLGRSERVRRMSAFSQRYYAELKSGHPQWPIHPIPMCVLATTDRAVHLRKIFIEEAGLTKGTLETGSVIRPPAGMEVWEVSGCQYAEVSRLIECLLLDLRPRLDMLEGVAIAWIAQRVAGIELGLSTGVMLEVDQLLLAPGPWLDAEPWRALVAPLGARVKKVVALHLEIPPPPNARAVLFEQEDAFLLPLEYRNHWLYSYTCQEWDIDPDAAARGLMPSNITEGRTILERFAPQLAEACCSGRVFCDAYSHNREPTVEPLDQDGRIIFAGTANGAGYRLAPAIATEAVQLLRFGNATGQHT